MFKLHCVSCLLVALLVDCFRSEGTFRHNIRPKNLASNNGSRPTKQNFQGSSKLTITNDGPTIFGSRTVFTVAVDTESNETIAYQWGTYIPYNWTILYSTSKVVNLYVDWWKSAGSKTCFFIVTQSQKQAGAKPWQPIGKSSSDVEVRGIA